MSFSQNQSGNFAQIQTNQEDLEKALDDKIAEIDQSGDPLVEIESFSAEDQTTNYAAETIPGNLYENITLHLWNQKTFRI